MGKNLIPAVCKLLGVAVGEGFKIKYLTVAIHPLLNT